MAGCSARSIDPANTTLDGNNAGRTLSLENNSLGGGFTIEGFSIQNGFSSSPFGGGIYVLSLNGDTIISANNISHNISAYSGGGVFLQSENSNIIFSDNTVSNNQSTNGGSSGGGVYLTSESSTISFIGNTITNNSAGAIGGAYIGGAGDIIYITNNTITGNNANTEGSDSGGLSVILYHDTDTAQIYNNIIWNNSTNGGRGTDILIFNDSNRNGTPSQVNIFNNDFDQSVAGFYSQRPIPIDSSNFNNLDPLFVDVTGSDYHLTESSPVIDMGTNSAPQLPTFDKDENPRIANGTVDMGAYEYQSVPIADNILPTITTVSPTNDDTGIAINTSISATFSETMDPTTITTNSFVISDGINNIIGTVNYSGTTVAFTPSVDLTYNTPWLPLKQE